MNNRQKKILKYVLEGIHFTVEEFQQLFNVSKRTLYYDLEKINYLVEAFGTLKVVEKKIHFLGDFVGIHNNLQNISDKNYSYKQERIFEVAYEIIKDPMIKINDLCEIFDVSRTTILLDLDNLKLYLSKDDIYLKYIANKGYVFHGDEQKVRNLFLELVEKDPNIFRNIDLNVTKFCDDFDLQLSDYSLGYLSKFISFIKSRIGNGYVLDNFVFEEKSEIEFYHYIGRLLGTNVIAEINYIAAFILSLPNAKVLVDVEKILKYVEILIRDFEVLSGLTITDKDHLEKSLYKHMLSSYYRIKYQFPAMNPILSQIKFKYEFLFSILKIILENNQKFPDFEGIREEEIGLITIYFGGYLETKQKGEKLKNRVVIVCPQGKAISKQLEHQLLKIIPNIEVLDTISLNNLKDFNQPFDYIVSTVKIEGYHNVIVVNPILSELDIKILLSKISNISIQKEIVRRREIIETIRRNAVILDEEELINDLVDLMFISKKEDKGVYQPMLYELLTEDKIKVAKSVPNWREGIKLASQPLLKDGSIEEEYVDEMISMVETYGPYIILTDYFALAHSSGINGVNRLGFSILILEEQVDMIGLPVKVFIVLASIDSESHLKALAQLSDLLSDEKAKLIIRNGDVGEILTTILEKSKI